MSKRPSDEHGLPENTDVWSGGVPSENKEARPQALDIMESFIKDYNAVCIKYGVRLMSTVELTPDGRVVGGTPIPVFMS